MIKIKHKIKPKLPPNALKAVVGFAGGGGVECGMLAAGVKPILSIEFDPTKPDLSGKIADCHEKNFGHPLLRMTVQEWAAKGFPGCPDHVDFAHFSPVCSNFSQETKRGDLEDDISSAQAIAAFIKAKSPMAITIENVPAYINSSSWKIINLALLENGYLPNVKIWDFSLYEVPQKRKRFICVAVKGGWFPAFQVVSPLGWCEAIADLIPRLKPIHLTSNQKKAMEDAINQPYIIPRLGYRKLPLLTPGWKPAPTIKRAIFEDNKGNSRNNVWTIWDGKQALNADIEVFRRLQTFPDWYQFPDQMSVAGSIIGYSVPPLIIEQIYKVLVDILVKKEFADGNF